MVDVNNNFMLVNKLDFNNFKEFLTLEQQALVFQAVLEYDVNKRVKEHFEDVKMQMCYNEIINGINTSADNYERNSKIRSEARKKKINKTTNIYTGGDIKVEEWFKAKLQQNK